MVTPPVINKHNQGWDSWESQHNSQNTWCNHHPHGEIITHMVKYKPDINDDDILFDSHQLIMLCEGLHIFTTQPLANIIWC